MRIPFKKNSVPSAGLGGDMKPIPGIFLFRSRWRGYAAAPLLPVLLMAPVAAYAQADSSSLSGTIMDASGAVVPNAKVTAHNEATGQDRSVTTNGGGSYTIPNLPTGSYTVKVEAKGFSNAVQQGTHVDPNIGARYDAQLKTGAASTNVTVQADANTLQTESASVGQLVTREQVKSIQLNGRNPQYLAELEPGVMRNAPLSSFNFAPDNSFHVDGARSQDTLTTLDGAPQVRTRGNTYSIGVADVDSTSQVQVLSTDYPAEYGRSDSGLIRMVPKSGTSQFHGAAYEYLRNSFLNANTWVRNQSDQPAISEHPQPFRFSQFGWNLNGPAYIPGHFNTSKQKLFFLAGQEYVRYRENVTTAPLKVPTALMRQGDFSELLSPTNIFYGKKVQIVDPRNGTPFPNNVIPPGRLSPNGLALLNAFPAPNQNSSSGNWEASAPYPQDQRKDTLVIDYVPAQAHHLRFSLLNNNYDYTTPFAGNFDRTPENWHWPDEVGVLNYTWTVSPTLINQALFSASADHITISYASDTLLDRSQYGINYPYIYPAAGKLVPNKIPTIGIADFTTLDGQPYPSHSGGVITRGADNLTKVLGNHTLKFGGSWERDGENDFDQITVGSTTPGSTGNQNGQFAFQDAVQGGVPTSGAAVANAALGQFYSYGEIGPKSYTLFRTNSYEIFAQDSWRVTPKLLLEYGVNYAVNPPFYASWGNQSVFDPRSYNPALAPAVDPTTGLTSGGDPLNGVVIPGSHFPSSAQGHVPADILNGQYNRLFRGYGRNYSKTVYSDLQPRFGFTYQVLPNTVVRGGAGRFVQRLPVTDQVQTGGNAPFQPSSSVTGGSIDNPAGAGTAAFPLQLSTEPYNLPSPEAYAWNFTVEQEIPNFATVTAAYVGRKGIHLQQLENINQLEPGTTQANPTVTQPDALRPYRGYAAILQDPDKGSSIYNALQVDLKRRLTKGFLFGVAYTWAKSLDSGSDQGYLLPNYYDPSGNWGPSDFDIRNTLVVNYVWDIPFASHAPNRLVQHTLGNWQVSGTTQAQTGEPFSVSTGDDYAGVGPGAGNQLWVTTSKPLVGKHFAGNNGSGTGQWFDPSVFVHAPTGTFAPRGTRNSIYGPGFQSWNIALQKNIHVIPQLENHVVTFRAEAFNFTNHPNLDSPANDSSLNNPNSGSFGQITTKGQTYGSERQIQFSLRYEF